MLLASVKVSDLIELKSEQELLMIWIQRVVKSSGLPKSMLSLIDR